MNEERYKAESFEEDLKYLIMERRMKNEQLKDGQKVAFIFEGK